MSAIVRELNFDCLVGPTHFFGGLSLGNIASLSNKAQLSNPKKAALQGLEKMRYLAEAGFMQAILPPHDRPDLKALKLMGFSGSHEKMLKDALKHIPDLLTRLCSSSAMWAANSATVCPKSDASDQKTHLTPANLVSMFHRSLEPAFVSKIFKLIFADSNLFTIHDPLIAHDIFSDEGAANHNRLCHNHGSPGLHIFVHGKESASFSQPTKIYPARQSLLAHQALVRMHALGAHQVIHAQQNPHAIDAGAFHNDVVALANENVFLCHESAFLNQEDILAHITHKYKKLTDEKLYIINISKQELSLENTVKSYLFNSQLLSKPEGTMLLFAPKESEQNSQAALVIKNLLEADNPIDQVAYFDISESMANGGGPACLRLRICLTHEEIAALRPGILFDNNLYNNLRDIINKYYVDNLVFENLFDNSYLKQSREALDKISHALGFKELYSWQS